MTTRNSILLSLSLSLLVGTTSIAGSEWTPLDRYLEIAAENDPGLKSDFARYLAEVQKVPQVGTLPDPMVAFGYFAVPTETRVGPIRARLSLSQKFPWFGLLDAREDVAAERAKALFEQFWENKSKLFYEVRKTYFDLYYTVRSLETTRENLEILRTFQQLALIKLESGKVSAVDELRVEMDLADLETQLELLEDRKTELRVAFTQLLGVSDQTEIDLPERLPDTSIEEDPVGLFARILEGNHALQRIRHESRSWEHQTEVARKEGRPDFEIGLDYSLVGGSRMPLANPSESGDDTIVFPRVGVSIPLFRRKYRAKVVEAEERQSASDLARQDLVDQLRTRFEHGYTDYRDGVRRSNLYAEQVETSNQALDLLLAEYSTESSNFEEVLRMERRLLGYELALERARADKSTAVAFLDYLLGSSTPRSGPPEATSPTTSDNRTGETP